MSTSTGRKLIVNADDFGMSAGINEGIIQAHRNGIVTSSSLMVRYPAAEEAAKLARENPRLSVGLHLDLGEWEFRDGQWSRLYQVLPQAAEADPQAIAAEAERQIAEFRRIMGTDPTHIDSHQHVHRKEPVCSILLRLANEIGVPVRHFNPHIQHCGGFFGQTARGALYAKGVAVETLCSIIRSLPEGITELGCHPGLTQDFRSAYAHERRREVETLCDPAVRRTIEEAGVQLVSYREATV